ncbi:MAG: prephenate dehydratase [Thermaerobacter sp.]|nr:prephenate dehydratase [Thermaerobacter sp.]
MRKLRVAIQGERGAYSEEAALALYGGEIAVLPCRTLPDVFMALENKTADAAAVPVENSRAGTVVEAYDQLARHSFAVYGEHLQAIHHCLLGLPGAQISGIRRATSHPQALSQCQEYLRGRGIEAVAAYDTAGSAKLLGEEGDKAVAAIASRRAAEIYGLTVLEAEIEDAKDNQTLFYAVGGRPAEDKEGQGRTVIAFTVPNRPHALVSCLLPFAERGLNLSKLESRPSGLRPFEYVFYTIIDDYAQAPLCAQALAQLRETASSLRILGSYRT